MSMNDYIRAHFINGKDKGIDINFRHILPSENSIKEFPDFT